MEITSIIRLDANESPFNINSEIVNSIISEVANIEFNRYPDMKYFKLRNEISNYAKAHIDNILVGNGSDELINLIFQALLNPYSNVLTLNPTFSMYEFYANANKVNNIKFELDQRFEFNLNEFLSFIKDKDLQMIVLCNPNNPTGRLIKKDYIEIILKNFRGYVVIDEAYFEFSNQSVISLLSEYNNLIVLRTLSKVFGIASVRIGYMIANTNIIKSILCVKSPYNISSFCEIAATSILRNLDVINNNLQILINERDRLYSILNRFKSIECFESYANFLLIRSNISKLIENKLKENKVFVRVFVKQNRLEDCIRITIGKKCENDYLVSILEEIL